jgi:hypothetical protein
MRWRTDSGLVDYDRCVLGVLDNRGFIVKLWSVRGVRWLL